MARYQSGTLTKITRKDGIERWLFRWTDRLTGRPRNKILGTVEKLPENSKKLISELAAIRLDINLEAPQETAAISMSTLIVHYKKHELLLNSDGTLGDGDESTKFYSTRDRYLPYLDKWIEPHWGEHGLNDIKTVAVEQWLKTLKISKGTKASNGTKAKIRNLMSALYSHAIRWEFTDRNPIAGVTRGSGVRQSAKREKEPEILEIDEMQRIVSALLVRERAAFALAMSDGLRRSEIQGLQWADIEFENHQINIVRGNVDQRISVGKTAASRRAVPLARYTAADLHAWREVTPYRNDEDWVFASDSSRAGDKRGKQPLWLSRLMEYHIQPTAKRLGIAKTVTWKTLRTSYSTLLKANGEDVKVVQELLRHASAKTTMDVYTKALTPQKRAAQNKLVSMIREQPVSSMYRVEDARQIASA